MENAIQERIHAKTRDSQLFEIFVNQFEFSPKTAEAAISTGNDFGNITILAYDVTEAEINARMEEYDDSLATTGIFF